VENLKVAVMGCIVNGPGESKHADIGISLPGTGEAPAAPVFIDGEKALTLRGEGIAQEFHKHRRDLHREALRLGHAPRIEPPSTGARQPPGAIPGGRLTSAPNPATPWLNPSSRQRHERHPAARARRAGNGSKTPCAR
jgi:hypothetical protein